MNRKHMLLATFALAAAIPSQLWAHCQVPCGIYGDETRFALLEEHVTTIEKSMNQIKHLSAAVEVEQPNVNQMVRWVNNKEKHADELTHLVTYYFLAQRIKPADPDDKEAHAKYVKHLTLLHQIMVHAMKAKQTTDLDHVKKLRSLIGAFKASYLGKSAAEGHAHGHDGGHEHQH